MEEAKGDSAAMRIRDLKGLGPKTEQMLSIIGITRAEQLLAGDPFEIYAQLRQHIPGTSLNALYALIGAIENVHWQEIKRQRRIEIILRLEDMGIAP
ncbi:TfoX/Sxy family DNA transformation protein [Noviherbaspirillum sp.]|uniref:TfoX/Sxy family DNA transformation protein n=1 Tax=Noviherbaspirillum sp. TaxID=1926288 RepID=UPI002FE2FF56